MRLLSPNTCISKKEQSRYCHLEQGQRKRRTRLSCISSIESQSPKAVTVDPVFSRKLLFSLIQIHESVRHCIRQKSCLARDVPMADEWRPKKRPVVSRYNILQEPETPVHEVKQDRKRKRSRQRCLSSEVLGRRSFHINSI